MQPGIGQIHSLIGPSGNTMPRTRQGIAHAICAVYFDVLTKEITESVYNLQKVGKMQKNQGSILTTNEEGSLLRSGEAQIIDLMSTRMPRYSISASMSTNGISSFANSSPS